MKNEEKRMQNQGIFFFCTIFSFFAYSELDEMICEMVLML